MDEAEMERVLKSLPPRGLAATILAFADKYQVTSHLAWKQVEATGNADFCAPLIVNLGFSIELLLKVFIVLAEPRLSFTEIRDAGIDTGGHPLSKLFDRVRPDLQQVITDSYGRQVGHNQTVAEFRAALLAVGDKPFVDWRYPFESNEIRHPDVQGMRKICDALGLAAVDEVRKVGR